MQRPLKVSTDFKRLECLAMAVGGLSKTRGVPAEEPIRSYKRLELWKPPNKKI